MGYLVVILLYLTAIIVGVGICIYLFSIFGHIIYNKFLPKSVRKTIPERTFVIIFAIFFGMFAVIPVHSLVFRIWQV